MNDSKKPMYHCGRISFNSAYSSRGVTFFHMCYFTPNGLMEYLYCTFLFIFDESDLYYTFGLTHTHIQIHHTGAHTKDPASGAILGLSLLLKDTIFKD